MRKLLGLALLLVPFLAYAQGDGQEELEHEIKQLSEGEQGPPPSAEQLKTLAGSIVDQMVTVRGLTKLHPVAMEVATREQIVQYVNSRIGEEMKPAELAGQEAALKRLGLLPEKMDMRRFMLDLYGEQVAGYYDPFKQKFFIASWMSEAMQAPIMAHELTHALQDQHFNLKPFLTPIADNSDATSARQAIVEGDAVLSMFAWLGSQAGQDLTAQPLGDTIRGQMSNEAFPVFKAAPPYFQQSLVFPYCDGVDFVQGRKKAGGWKAIDALYADIPRSSTQILHPETYRPGPKHQEPVAVDLGMSLPGWKQVHTDVLGELVIRTLMESYFDKTRAAAIAQGWAGDRYRAFQKTGARSNVRNTMVVHRSIWITPEDAAEYADAYVELLPKKYQGGSGKTDKFGTLFVTAEDGFSRVERKDKEVVIVDGAPDAETADKAAQAAWGSKRAL